MLLYCKFNFLVISILYNIRMLNLDSEIQYLNGIGPKRAQAFAKLGIKAVGDFLTFFPAQYQDRTKIISIRDIYKKLRAVYL